MDRIVAIHKSCPIATCHARQLLGAARSADELRKLRRRHEADWGVPVEEIQRGIKHGVRKINVDTDCRIASPRHSQGAQRNADKFDPRGLISKPPRSHEKSLQSPA